MVDWGIACLLAATAGPKSVARTMDAANCAAVLLSVPISYHFLRLYSATGRACRRKWRYIKILNTHLYLTFYLTKLQCGQGYVTIFLIFGTLPNMKCQALHIWYLG